MDRRRNGWYDRPWEETERITLDFVRMNCSITDREKELLEIINKRKMVRRDLLEVISPSYRNIKSRTRIINMSLNKLFKNMCIDKVHEKQSFKSGNSPAVVALDRAGSIILDIPHKRRIIHNKSQTNGKIMITRRLPSNYRHIHGVNKLEVETILFCEQNDCEILEWVLEKPQTIHYGSEEIKLIPDIGLSLKLNLSHPRVFYAYIEFDTGSESVREKEPRIIYDKIIKYKKYKLSRLWEKDYPVFPALILVTEDASRTQFFNKKCKENGLFGMGIYYKNYTKFLHMVLNMPRNAQNQF